MTETALIQGCKSRDRAAQKELYQRYAPRFFGICIRYVGDKMQAEDLMVTALYKIFNHIDGYESRGSFEGWMKRIVVNECLMHLRKAKKFADTVEVREDDAYTEIETDAMLEMQDLKDMVNALPVGYRTVFNLYVIEGYKHREIAEMLDISINTSKSQLILAKKKLREMIRKNEYNEAG